MNELPQVTHQRQQQRISMISNAEHMEEDALKVLAPELLQNVIKYLPKQDLKHLRSTCSRLVDFVNHSLFDSIFLSVDPRHLVIATLMLQRFGPALRTVIISPLEYRGLEEFDHHRNLRRTPDTHTKLSSNHSIHKEHRDRAYKWHRALVARQNRTKCQDCLRQVLRYAPNLRKVIFTHRNRSITDQELEEICCWESNWKSCPLDRETHNTFRLSPWYGRVTTRPSRPETKVSFSAAFVGSMMVLLSSSNLRAQELIMEACGRTRDTWSVGSDEFDELAPIISTTPIFMAHLRKLRLATCGWDRENQPARAVANFLSQAECLECLYLTCGRPATPESQVDDLLSQSRFPNLLTLIIEGGTIIDKGLLPTFCGIPKLRHLVLEDVRMKRPHWRTFIDGVKSSLDLTSLHMNLLFDYDNIYRLEDGSKIYIEGENNVDSFLHSKGPHPFPDTATAFCTKGLDEIFGVFRNGLPEDYDQPREAQQCYELYF